MKILLIHAHCEGPCGIYDSTSAPLAAEAAVSVTEKNIKFCGPPIENI